MAEAGAASALRETSPTDSPARAAAAIAEETPGPAAAGPSGPAAAMQPADTEAALQLPALPPDSGVIAEPRIAEQSDREPPTQRTVEATLCNTASSAAEAGSEATSAGTAASNVALQGEAAEPTAAAAAALALQMLLLCAEARERDEQLRACRAEVTEKEEALWVQRQQLEVRSWQTPNTRIADQMGAWAAACMFVTLLPVRA